MQVGAFHVIEAGALERSAGLLAEVADGGGEKPSQRFSYSTKWAHWHKPG